MAKEHDQVIEAIKHGIMLAYDKGLSTELEIETIGGAVRVTVEWVPETEGEEHA